MQQKTLACSTASVSLHSSRVGTKKAWFRRSWWHKRKGVKFGSEEIWWRSKPLLPNSNCDWWKCLVAAEAAAILTVSKVLYFLLYRTGLLLQVNFSAWMCCRRPWGPARGCSVRYQREAQPLFSVLDKETRPDIYWRTIYLVNLSVLIDCLGRDSVALPRSLLGIPEL